MNTVLITLKKVFPFYKNDQGFIGFASEIPDLIEEIINLIVQSKCGNTVKIAPIEASHEVTKKETSIILEAPEKLISFISDQKRICNENFVVNESERSIRERSSNTSAQFEIDYSEFGGLLTTPELRSTLDAALNENKQTGDFFDESYFSIQVASEGKINLEVFSNKKVIRQLARTLEKRTKAS